MLSQIAVLFPSTDGVGVEQSPERRVQSDGSLLLERVRQKEDSGVYTCTASTKQGHSATGSVRVSVLGELLSMWLCYVLFFLASFPYTHRSIFSYCHPLSQYTLKHLSLHIFSLQPLVIVLSSLPPFFSSLLPLSVSSLHISLLTFLSWLSLFNLPSNVSSLISTLPVFLPRPLYSLS